MKKSEDDPTGENKRPDGSPSPDPLDEKSRFRVVSAGDSSAGAIGFDDLGQPRWTWITEMDGSDEQQDDTFDYLKALDNDSLSIKEDSGADVPKASPGSGYDPYDTARIKITGKFRRR